MKHLSRKRQYFIYGAWISTIAFPIFSILDNYVYPEYLLELFCIRITMTFISALMLLLLYYGPDKYLNFCEYVLFLSPSIAISVMPFITGDGFASNYFGGNIIVILAASILYEDSTKKFILIITINLLFHFLLLSLVPEFNLPGFMSHLFFLGSNTIIGLILNIQINSFRTREFELNNKNEYFVKVFAHDLKNKLYCSRGSLQLFKSHPEEETISIIEYSLNQMNLIVGNLVNVFSKDDIVLKKTEVNISKLIESFKKEWELPFKGNKINFTIENHELDSIYADDDYMKLVWENLLSNALQNTPRNGEVKICFTKTADFNFISFSNSGDLVPEEQRSEMFEKYLRPQKHSPYNKGLGLNYSSMMCKKHGGSLEYKVNELNQNDFIVQLPLN